MVTKYRLDRMIQHHLSGLTPRLRGDGYLNITKHHHVTAASGLTPRLRGDGYERRRHHYLLLSLGQDLRPV